MHEVSLGGTLRDYLTGKDIEETTFEEIRQELARFLVEEKGYPKDRIRSKVKLSYTVDGEEFERLMDFVIHDENDTPLLLIIFCSGNVSTYERETLCAARLIQGGPVPLALTTDSMEAVLIDTGSGECLRRGMSAVPPWNELKELAATVALPKLTDEQREKQTRIFHAYSGFLFGSCCKGACPPAGPKK